MPKFEKGKEKTGGRVKGTPNKDTLRAREIAERLGVCPLTVLLLHAKGDWKSLGYESGVDSNGDYLISPDTRTKSAGLAAPYIFPKLANVEIKGEINGKMTLEEFLQQVKMKEKDNGQA